MMIHAWTSCGGPAASVTERITYRNNCMHLHQRNSMALWQDYFSISCHHSPPFLARCILLKPSKARLSIPGLVSSNNLLISVAVLPNYCALPSWIPSASHIHFTHINLKLCLILSILCLWWYKMCNSNLTYDDIATIQLGPWGKLLVHLNILHHISNVSWGSI